jgi:sugar (pentulose or hexulose) kinase
VLSAAPADVVGVGGMAEAGLLVDRKTGSPRSEIIPWYDPRSTPQTDTIGSLEPVERGYRRSGLHLSFKYSLSKIMWLAERDPEVLRDAVWLSVPDYLVFRLTGAMATDPTLAARTYAFDLFAGRWDEDWIGRVGLDPALFPRLRPSGFPAGEVSAEAAAACRLAAGTPVAVSGHDHLCALLGAGIVEAGPVLDSMGTAESLLGVLSHVSGDAFASGLTIAPHVLAGRYCWLGGLPASGGSVEWIRRQLSEQPLPYGEVERLARGAGPRPTRIIYFPYLTGSGAPWHDAHVRAAFLGLRMDHTRGHVIRGVLEGTAFETRSMQHAAEGLTGSGLTEVVTVGGGTRNREWLQIKADVTGKRHLVPEDEEAVVRGAAYTAAVGARMLDLEALPSLTMAATIEPNPERFAEYQTLYEEYRRFQGPLHRRDAPLEAHVGPVRV